MMTSSFDFGDNINLNKFTDIQVTALDAMLDKYAVEYASGNETTGLSEADACAIQRAWRLAHGRHPLTGALLIELLQLITGLADEAVTSREIDPDEDDTPEVLAGHRDTVDQGEALIRALKEH